MPKMICIGPGPGPKNVLVEYEDGSRTVVPYAIWKYKLRPSGGHLSDTYAGVAGFIQFDPVTREVNGKEVTDVTVKAVGSQKLVKVTIWPDFDFEGVEVAKGGFLAADGKFESRMGQKADGSAVEYLNLSAKDLAYLPPVKKLAREVVSRSSSTSSSGDNPLPF